LQLTFPDSGKRSSPGTIRNSLAAATCLLLGAVPTPSRAGEINGATLVYTEPDRVTAVETVVKGSKEWDDGRSFSLRFAIDVLSGASANGAVPADRAQTFTRPSGNATYTVQPGKTPLDPSFRDTRWAGSAVWVRPLGRFSRANLGIQVSTETDYLSLGASAGIAHDLAMRNTTLAAGVSFAHDTVRPIGGAPEPLTPMAVEDENGSGGNPFKDDGEEGEGAGPGKGKDVLDFMAGLTQVLDRATIAPVNYSLGFVSGYLNDPYKIVSVVQGPDLAEAGDPIAYLYERRPGHRSKQSFYGGVRRRVGSAVADASYRYYWDSWSVRSSTAELRWDQPLGGGKSIRPHYRYYRQKQAGFYSHYLTTGGALPSFTSADSRLGSFTASTFGMEAVHTLRSGPAIKIGIEYYLQRGNGSPPEAFGTLVEQDLFPEVSAWMVRAGATVPVQW